MGPFFGPVEIEITKKDCILSVGLLNLAHLLIEELSGTHVSGWIERSVYCYYSQIRG